MPGENVKHILEPNGTEVTTAAGGARRYRKPLKAFRWCDINALLSESARIQREVVQLQAFSQSAVQSTKMSTRHLAHFKIGTERLSHLKKIADAPAMSAPTVEDVSSEEHREGGAETSPQHGERTPGDQVEATEADSSSEIQRDHEGEGHSKNKEGALRAEV